MKRSSFNISVFSSLSLLFLSIDVCAKAVENPCYASLISIVDRPTVGDSACVVANKDVLLEIGYQYQKLTQHGYEHNLPQAEVRFGLPQNTELAFVLSNYITQTGGGNSGAGATSVAIKHEFGYTTDWIWSAETLFTLPSGSAEFGSHGLGVTVNGIFSYNITSQWNLTGMFGIATLTEPNNAGGGRFTTFNPDLVLSWTMHEIFSVYGEIYGQSKTATDQGNGFNMDAGILYLLARNLTMDFEVGQRISGSLGGFNHYVGTGLSLKIT